MPIRFTVLASGSAGNVSLIQSGGFGLLIDAGLGPRQLASRLTAAGASWADINAVVLTHTHSDHWHDRTLNHLRRRRVSLHCHPEHIPALLRYGSEFAGLHSDGLVNTYQPDAEWSFAPGLRCRALELSHDGGPTFGFRFEAESAELFGTPSALAYAADLGTWTPALASALSDVDLLAIEFNHDVAMQHASGRSFQLIRRVLGDRGHLSNSQAAALVRETQRLSPPGRLRHLVQLHLSRECNRPDLAAAAGRLALGDQDTAILTATQETPGPVLHAGFQGGNGGTRKKPSYAPRRRRATQSCSAQLWLPGFGPEADSADLASKGSGTEG